MPSTKFSLKRGASLRQEIGFPASTTPDIDRAAFRFGFLDAVKQVEPMVLDSLLSSGVWGVWVRYGTKPPGAWEAFEAVPPGIRVVWGKEFSHVVPDGGTIVYLSSAQEPELVALREALFAWARRWHLEDAWLLDVALGALWTKKAGRGPIGEWGPLSVAYKPPETETLRGGIAFPVLWDPMRETKGQAKARVRASCDKWIEERLTQIGKQEKEWRLSHEPNQELFGWLARFQVKEESLEDIAKSVPTSKQNVSQRIHKVAVLIGLTLRAPLPGIKKRRR